MAQSGRKVSLSDTHATEKDDVGLGLDEGQAEEILHLSPVELLGPLFKGLDDGKTGGCQATFQSPLLARLVLGFEESGEVIDVSPVFLGGMGAERLVLLADPMQTQGLELFLKPLIGRVHAAPPERS